MGAGTEAIYLLSQPYYALHAIAFFSYFIARHAATTSSSDLFRHHLFHRELQTTLSLCVLLCLKWRKSSTLEAFLGDGLLYGKGVLLLLSAILDLRLAAWYFISFVAIFLLFQQPSFKGLGNVIHMTPVQLENHLSEGNSEKIWLIEFRAVWSPECIRSGRVFINLSARYSTGDLYFGSVDVGRFPKAAEVYDLSLGVNKGELPTYIMFKGGSEVSRLSKAGSLSESVIATYFELDRHLVFDLDKNYVGGRQTSTS